MPVFSRPASLLCLLLPAWLVAAEPAPALSVPAVVAPANASVVETRFWEANKLFASGKVSDLTAARAALQAAADAEFTHAQLLLGNYLLTGAYGFKKNERKGAGLFRLAAERGNAYAKVSLGQCYLSGTGVSKDETKAVEWLNAALLANADYSSPTPPPDYFTGNTVAGDLQRDPATEARASAHFFLGQILSGRKEAAAAHEHFLAAANAGPNGQYGVYQAAVQAAFDYAFGQGAPRDLAKANEMLDLSRRLGTRMNVALIHNSVAQKTVDDFAVVDLEEAMTKSGEQAQAGLQLKIAASLADKKSRDYNPKEAAKWYQLAAESGQGWAMLELGLLHCSGALGEPNYTEAFRLFTQAGDGETPKHYLATANLGICYLRGLGTPTDAGKAAQYFQKSRDFTFAGYLGTLNQAPATPVGYEADKALADTWARKKKDAHAYFITALRNHYGWENGTPDPKEALKWFKKAADSQHGEALCFLGVMAETQSQTENNWQEKAKLLQSARDYYQKAMSAGSIEGQLNYAVMLAEGKGISRDVTKAESLVRETLQRMPDHARAHNNLGALLQGKLAEIVDTIDTESKDNYRQAMLQHYEAAAKKEMALAANNLALLHYDGKLVPRNLSLAYDYFEKAARWGMSSAHYFLGYMHENGEGVPKTYTEAAYHYRLAGLDGHPQAIKRLSNLYLTGQGITPDLDRAAYWLNEAARRGQRDALPKLADVLLRKGENEAAINILQNLAQTITWTKGNFDSAGEITGFGCERLSRCYRDGVGVKADLKKAQIYLEQAIDWGNGDALDRLAQQQISTGKIDQGVATMEKAAKSSANAAFHLGQMHYFGTHVSKDETKALELIRKAASLNQPDALYFLAAMTQKKLRFAPTLDEAISFAEIAEACGHDKAAALRELLEQQQRTMADAPEEGAGTRST